MSDATVNWPVERIDPKEAGFDPQRLERVREVIDRCVRADRLLGMTVAVTRDGRLACTEAVGHLDLARTRPMPLDAIFRIYSMTKVVTTVAILMLLEEGRFLLNGAASDFIPALANLKVAETGDDGTETIVDAKREITIHDLLTHTSGLDYNHLHEAIDAGWTLEQFCDDIANHPLKHHPGEVWEYSTSIDVLGRIVEVASGMPLDAFFAERMFAPLGMTDTDFYVPQDKVDRLAAIADILPEGGLRKQDNFLHCNTFAHKPSLLSGGGGLVSTTSDYLRLAQMLGNGGRLGDTRLLGRKTIEMMSAEALPKRFGAFAFDGRRMGLGVGIHYAFCESHTMGSPGVFGWGGAASTECYIDPAERMVTVIMQQTTGHRAGELAQLVKSAIYAALE